MAEPQCSNSRTNVALPQQALAPAVHKHDFSSISALVREERLIISEFPIAVSYLLSLVESERKGESNGDELTYGMRGQPSSRTRENYSYLRSLEAQGRKVCEALAHPLTPEAIAFHVAEFAKNVGEQRVLLGTIRLSALDVENITELLTTKSLPLPKPLREWELTRRRRLDEVGGELSRRMQPIYEAYIPQLLISVRPFLQFGLEFDDLHQEACRGLIKAIRAFDPERGAAFPAYLKTFLHNHLHDAIVEQSRLIRLSPVVLKQIAELNSADEELMKELAREPTIQEVAKKLKISTSTATGLKSSAAIPSSLDAPIDRKDISGATLHEFVSDELIESADQALLRSQLLKMVQTSDSPLSARERSILIAYFGLDGEAPQTSDQLAVAYGITTGAGIRYIISGAIKKLAKMC